MTSRCMNVKLSSGFLEIAKKIWNCLFFFLSQRRLSVKKNDRFYTNQNTINYLSVFTTLWKSKKFVTVDKKSVKVKHLPKILIICLDGKKLSNCLKVCNFQKISIFWLVATNNDHFCHWWQIYHWFIEMGW